MLIELLSYLLSSQKHTCGNRRQGLQCEKALKKASRTQMVQDFPLMKILLALSTFIAFPFAASVTLADVQADINTIIAVATTYDQDIIALSADTPSVITILDVHTDAEVLISSLNQLTADLKSLPLPIDDDDVTSLLNNITSYVSPITDALSEIILKKSAFASSDVAGVPAIILRDLIGLNASNSNLETTILATFPEMDCHTTAVDSAFANAIAAYTN
ncbi:hypothetical protein JR316_0009389 [Psilocybe cubensis]|uniref:Uncharacterized protein n=2 Tax=Psilocybe cubensis TaxID=181762 RepID=A0ACB8GTD6_PSICU|nr:hypothetical protein JR316_0009389 [Psilocybe cubensis]KAH9478926.1 hypothetical protein JR316_0009389 [Psilocybe cubensis]